MDADAKDDRGLVLVVEGVAAASADLIAAALLDEGYTCEVAQDAETGLERAIALRPVLVIFSWRMERMDGPEFYQRLRDAGLDGPVLMCSAWSEAEGVAKELGVPFLAKPFDLDAFYAAVERLLPPR